MEDTASERDLEFEADTSDRGQSLAGSFKNPNRARNDSLLSDSDDASEDGGANYRQDRLWSTYSGDGAAMH